MTDRDDQAGDPEAPQLPTGFGSGQPDDTPAHHRRTSDPGSPRPIGDDAPPNRPSQPQPNQPPPTESPPPPPRGAHHNPPPTSPTGQIFVPPSVERIRIDDIDTGFRRPPTQGWRRIVYRSTGGRINPRLSAKEEQRAELERHARTPLRGNRRIGVVGKGGVGKTTIAACLGSVLAELRHDDRVVAIDADTAFGKLGDRIDPRAVDSYWELVTDPHLRTFADVRSRLGSNTAGLFVLPADSDHRHPLIPTLYGDALARLDRHFAITIIDCGATMDSPLTRTVAHNLDAAIVVATPWEDGVSIAHQTLDWLAAHGTPHLLRRTMVVVNNSDGNAKPHVYATVAESFLDRGIPSIEVPFDKRLRPGGVIDLTHGMSRATRHQFLKIAAALGSRIFADNVHRHPPPSQRGPAG